MMRADLFIAGDWRSTGDTAELRSPYSGEVVGLVAQASGADVDEAVASAYAAAQAPLHPAERSQVLGRAADLVERHRAEIVDTIVAESGFTVSDAAGEVTRAHETLKLSAGEAVRIHGRAVPIDSAPGVRRRLGFTVRVPVGVVCAITPFNSPLNTVAHKVGPALAAGNAVVLKPASQTPTTAAILVRLLLEAGLRPDLVQLVHGPGSVVGEALLADRRIGFYAFTGSTATGEHIARSIGLRRSQLELGAVSPTLVLADADLDAAAARIVASSFRKAGQVCTSIQRLLVEAPVLDDVVERLRDKVEALIVGDPADHNTFVGPLITRDDAARVESWVEAAVDGGGRRVAGGRREDSLVWPALVVGPPADSRLAREELFGPVLAIDAVDGVDEAVVIINESPFGLATGVFTNDIERGLDVAHRLRMGAVHINETSSSRVDLMPYGGVKQSGYGLEGPRYAVEDMTEERLITISYGGRG